MVREAESPLHDRFDLKSMLEKDSKAFRAAFVEIREWILDNTSKIADTSFLSDEFLTLDFGDSEHMSWGTPEAVGQRAPERRVVRSQGRHRHRQNENRKIRLAGRSRRQRVTPFFSAVVVPVADDRRCIEITCRRECRRAMLELSVDENMDPTWDRVARDQTADVVLRDVMVDGHAVDESRLVERDGNVVGVWLGDLVKGQEVVVEASYSLSSYFDSVGMSEASLVVEVVSLTDNERES